MRRACCTVVALVLAGSAWAEAPIVDLRAEVALVPSFQLAVESEDGLRGNLREDADVSGMLLRAGLSGWADIVAPHEDEAGFGLGLVTSFNALSSDVLTIESGPKYYTVEMRGYSLDLGAMLFYQLTPHLRIEGGPFGGFAYLEERVARPDLAASDNTLGLDYGARIGVTVSQLEGFQGGLHLGWYGLTAKFHENDKLADGTTMDYRYAMSGGGAFVAAHLGWRF